MIQVKNLTVKTNEISFDVENVDISYMNALRRTMISKLKTFAIHYLKVNKNTSKIPEDFIAHRIGLIPIRSLSQEPIVFPYHFYLKKINTTNQVLHVYSHDILDNENKFFIKENILLFSLHPNTEIDIECFVTEGTGNQHSKWCPVVAPRCVHSGKSNAFLMTTEVIENYDTSKILIDSMKILQNDLEFFKKENNII